MTGAIVNQYQTLNNSYKHLEDYRGIENPSRESLEPESPAY